MNGIPSPLPPGVSRTVEKSGTLLLWAGLSFGLLLIPYLAWAFPEVLPFLPLVIIGGIAAFALFRYPLANLCFILALFVFVSRRQDGIQVAEALYGVYTLGFLAHWFTTRLYFYGDRICDTAAEKALFAFLVLATLTTPFLTTLFGGNFRLMFSEWIALSLLALYFPVKEAMARYSEAPKYIGLTIGWIGLFIAVQNMVYYREGLLTAEHFTEVMGERVASNESLLAMSSLFFLTLLTFFKRIRYFAPLLLGFLLTFSGLILSQSRGYWVAFLLGAAVMFVLVDRQHRIRLLFLGLIGLVLLLAAGMIFFREYVDFIVAGLLNRFVSLGTAATQDLSLVNRFYESSAVWDRIIRNPILGYGMGVSYRFYDLVHRTTDLDTFVHNGFLSLWYKFGLWGFLLVLFFWFKTIWNGIRAFKSKDVPKWTRLCALGACITLVAITLAANTSNPFHNKENTFAIGLLTGLAGGAYRRLQLHVTASAED